MTGSGWFVARCARAIALLPFARWPFALVTGRLLLARFGSQRRPIVRSIERAWFNEAALRRVQNTFEQGEQTSIKASRFWDCFVPLCAALAFQGQPRSGVSYQFCEALTSLRADPLRAIHVKLPRAIGLQRRQSNAQGRPSRAGVAQGPPTGASNKKSRGAGAGGRGRW